MPSERSSGGFGARLRDARERRGISLRQIANATKISVAVLEALERNDISKLPGGIFGRAFVRSYASEVGLDPEATIQDFIAQFPNDSVTAGHPTSGQVEDSVAVESERRTAGTFLWLLLIAVPIAGGLLYFSSLGRPAILAPAANADAPRTVTESHPSPPPPSSASTPEQASAAPPAVAADAAAVPTAAPAALPTVSAAATPVPADARPAAAPTDQLTVALTAKRPCWVSATVDGQTAIERLLKAGDHQTLTVRREMVLTAGDASAIVLQFNGANARSLGKSGEVVTARFSLANYKDYLQAR
jgi:cytoskeleton protein RodZ